MKRRIGINGFLLFLFVAVFFLFRDFFSGYWQSEFPDIVFDIVGLCLIFLGFLLRISGRGYKAEKSQSGHSLITGGPYSLTRNPMYLGIFLIGIGIVFYLLKWWFVFIFIVLFLLRYLPQIKHEEKLLDSRFGKEYKSYCQRVPRLFPGITSLFKKNIRKALPLKYKWLRKEILNAITIIIITFLIELLNNLSRYGKARYMIEPLILAIVLVSFSLLFLFLLKQNTA